MSERIALCPGSFDPITVGHEDIVRRALALADRVIVAVGYAPQQSKQGMFGVDERVALIREVFADEPRIETDSFQGLLVDYARKRGAQLVVKGLRSVADFEYEMQMALMNRAQHPGLDTVFLAPDPAHSFVSATLVRQIATLGGDVSPFVSPAVYNAVFSKVGAAQYREATHIRPVLHSDLKPTNMIVLSKAVHDALANYHAVDDFAVIAPTAESEPILAMYKVDLGLDRAEILEAIRRFLPEANRNAIKNVTLVELPEIPSALSKRISSVASNS